MSSRLTAANAARLDAILDRPHQFDRFGITSFRALIEEGRFSHASADQEPVAYYDRRKSNRMNAKEQAAYEARLKTTKTVHRLHLRDGGSYIVPKLVYAHFTARHAVTV